MIPEDETGLSGTAVGGVRPTQIAWESPAISRALAAVGRPLENASRDVQYRMVRLACREFQCSSDVFGLKIREILQYLLP